MPLQSSKALNASCKFYRFLFAVLAFCVTFGFLHVMARSSNIVSERSMGALREYADLHDGTLVNNRMDDDALEHCVVSVDGAMMPPHDIELIPDDRMSDHPVEHRAVLALSSEDPLHVLHLGSKVSRVRIRDSVFTMRTPCLVSDLRKKQNTSRG